jgi:hypothetical protein
LKHVAEVNTTDNTVDSSLFFHFVTQRDDKLKKAKDQANACLKRGKYITPYKSLLVHVGLHALIINQQQVPIHKLRTKTFSVCVLNQKLQIIS